VREEIGFRVIERRGTQILLNGEPLYLRGISLHEEAPDGQGRAWSPEHAATLLGWAQELGANFVRLAHYPHADHVARLADRLGLLVWAEIPVYWTLAFESPETLALAKQQLSELVARDRNRASVVFWSIGNETPVGEARNAFMQGLAEHARREDDTRLVAAALETPMAEAVKMLASHAIPAAAGIVRDEWVLEVSDPLAEMVDVPGLNEYFGWYYETPLSFATPLSAHTLRRISLENLPRLRLRLGVERPVLLSEFGADALAGFHAPESELAVFSEEYQALVFRQQLAMLEHQPAVRGVSPWLLKDFRSPIRLHQAMQGYWNRKGLVADDGRRKLAFSVLRDHYRARAAAGG
jgi:beta-glucuronidase